MHLWWGQHVLTKLQTSERKLYIRERNNTESIKLVYKPGLIIYQWPLWEQIIYSEALFWYQSSSIGVDEIFTSYTPTWSCHQYPILYTYLNGSFAFYNNFMIQILLKSLWSPHLYCHTVTYTTPIHIICICAQAHTH